MSETVPDHIRELARKYLKGTISPEEKETFDAWYASQPQDELVWDDPLISSETDLKQQIFGNIQAQRQSRSRSMVAKLAKPVAAAAAVLVLLAGGIWWLRSDTKTINKPAGSTVAISDKAPGKTGAILVLADGTKISLDDATQGRLAEQGTARIENGNGKLIYSNNNKEQAVAVKNTMVTPAGRQYQLTLPDGTRVWLNAASELTFPTAFTGTTREVTLTGEAYFEVAAGTKPFMVMANGTAVQVLGTHFNVNAYLNEAGVRATLLEGAVKVVKGTAYRLPRPGQQALAAAGKEQISVTSADTEAATAWMSDEFIFRQTDVKTVMRQIARWYDMEIEYQGDMTGISITGNVSRTVYVSSLLKALELAKTIKCKIEGQRIIVMPYSL